MGIDTVVYENVGNYISTNIPIADVIVTSIVGCARKCIVLSCAAFTYSGQISNDSNCKLYATAGSNYLVTDIHWKYFEIKGW